MHQEKWNRNGVRNWSEIYPQLCIVHQIRNSIKYVGSINQKQFAQELKSVYQAFTKMKHFMNCIRRNNSDSQPIYIRTILKNSGWNYVVEIF